MRLGDARTPHGMRLYAIGDVHGRLDMLQALHARIADDLNAAPPADHRIIHLGDYCDRGPDSAGVIGYLAALAGSRADMAFLRGNHDDMFMQFLRTPDDVAAGFLGNGGDATLRSYGCAVGSWRAPATLAEDANGRIPHEHLDFLRSTKLSLWLGDYFFCHAGVRPGVPLGEQVDDDLMWIREEFLWSDEAHAAVVVHGHTATQAPETRSNRINVDTGAVFGGPLSAVVLQSADHRFLAVDQADSA
ncbi:MAG: metallophosphoesterase family protein [Alphaproteobacteria bacterium]